MKLLDCCTNKLIYNRCHCPSVECFTNLQCQSLNCDTLNT